MSSHCGTRKRRYRRGKKFRGGIHGTVLLMGLPNVGKSAIFSRFTGLDVMVSNYFGTTVEFYEGPMRLGEKNYLLKDAPGIYNLEEPSDDAERVAAKMLDEEPDAVVFVLDALNFESSLHLLLQVLEKNIPTVVALNRSDLMRPRGIAIDHGLLQRRLGVNVLPTVALRGNSLDVVKYALENAIGTKTEYDVPGPNKRWNLVEQLTSDAFRREPKKERSDKHGFLVKPWPGIPIALAVLALVFSFVIGFGMGLRQFVLLPFFRGFLFVHIENAVEALFTSEVLKNILIGEDYGFLIKGIEWPFALVLPYVISFYAAMSLLEDVGYLPRLAVLLDGLFKKVGLNGSSIIPLLLGYGCGIPAIMATRSLPSKKQRLSVATMVCFAVPCVAQTGVFIALVAAQSIPAFLAIFAISILALVIIGVILDKVNKQQAPPTLFELPELLWPKPKLLWKKISFRIRHYLKDGAVPMVIAVAFVAVFYELGALQALGRAAAPLVSGWLHLPEEAATSLVLGIVRRELTLVVLEPMGLSTVQFFTASLVALFYVPCIAMIATLAKEFSIRTAVVILVLTTVTALFLGGLFAQMAALITA